MTETGLKELLDRAGRRDHDAFESFYEHTAPQLLTYIRSRLAKDAEAEQVLERSYMTAWHQAGAYQQQPVQAWLQQIAAEVIASS